MAIDGNGCTGRHGFAISAAPSTPTRLVCSVRSPVRSSLAADARCCRRGPVGGPPASVLTPACRIGRLGRRDGGKPRRGQRFVAWPQRHPGGPDVGVTAPPQGGDAGEKQQTWGRPRQLSFHERPEANRGGHHDNPGSGKSVKTETVCQQQQSANQITWCLKPLRWLLGEQFSDQFRQFRVEIGSQRQEVRRWLAAVAQQLLQHRSVGERRPARKHEKQGATKRIQIASHVGAARILRLLRRDVVESSERHACRGQFSIRRLDLVHPGQAHIDQLQLAVSRDQHIGRLDIAMHHGTLVRVLQSFG